MGQIRPGKKTKNRCIYPDVDISVWLKLLMWVPVINSLFAVDNKTSRILAPVEFLRIKCRSNRGRDKSAEMLRESRVRVCPNITATFKITV